MASRPRTVRVGLVQTHATDDARDNLARTLALLERAADDGAEIVCTQELFSSLYFCQEEDPRHFALAEPIPGPAVEALGALARRRGISVLGSLFEKRAPGLFHNTSVLLGPDGSLLGRYRKMHIPDDPRFYEKFYFTPGDLGFVAYDTPSAKVGPLVCWDQWYPEAARLTALAGAEILFYPTAIGTWTGELELMETQHDAWRTMQRAHAIANGVFVVAANRIGQEGEIRFWGRSFIAAPDGRILAEAGEAEAVLVEELELEAIDEARQGWPFLRDRRIDAYRDLTKRYRE